MSSPEQNSIPKQDLMCQTAFTTKSSSYMMTGFTSSRKYLSIIKGMVKITFVRVSKKSCVKNYSDFQIMSVINLLLKVFLKIITYKHVFSVRALFHRCRDVDCNGFACFIQEIEMLESVWIRWPRFVNLYWNQSSSTQIQVKVGTILKSNDVRQGWLLFELVIIYQEQSFQKFLEESGVSIRNNDESGIT